MSHVHYRLSAFLLAALPAGAQVPNTLLHSIPAPPTGAQSYARLGSSVAVDGDYTVVGAPFDDSGGMDSGVVKVFDSTTGALLFVLPNPGPGENETFGASVAISGTRVVAGAPYDRGGAGSAYVYDLSSGTPTMPVATLDHSGLADVDAFGWSVAISGTRVVVGAPFDDTETETINAGSAHVYDLSSDTPTVPVATLSNPGPAESDHFGYSVAISDMRVAVGAERDDAGATDAGSVYVYDLGSGTPTVPVATLSHPDPAASDLFGNAVAISGTRVVVGAYLDDTVTTNAGSAYVYDLNSGTPTVPVAALNNPGPAVLDGFGGSVAISGTRVVVGASLEDTGAFNSGSVYVYDLTGGTPAVPVATLRNPGPAGDDFFGNSVAVSGARVVVGVPYDDAGAHDAGSAYVFDVSSATPAAPVATLNNSGPSSLDYFGSSVALSGTRMVVGSHNEAAGGLDAVGSAYVYDFNSATPAMPVSTLNNPGPAANDIFGSSVAISGTRVVVGACQDDTGAHDAGSAYVYDLSSGSPSDPAATLNNPGAAAGDHFGSSVAISGTRVVVGAYGDDTGANNAGSAYVYDLSSGTPTVPMLTLNNPGPTTRDYFGISVALSGKRLVVGAVGDNAVETNSGKVYVYDLSSDSPTVPIATLNNPGPAANNSFGYSVAISGTRVVVGAYYPESGSAWVFDLDSSTPTVPVVTLTKPNPATYDYFGISVAISGSRVVVGADLDDMGATDAGSAYVYDLDGATPGVPVAVLNNPGPSEEDRFATAVAIDGTTIAIGTPHDDSVLADKGFAYVFGPNPKDLDSDGLLDSWEITHFGSTAGHGPLDDADEDGFNALLEEAFSTNPLVPDAGAMPAFINEDGYLTITITKRPGVFYTVQSAGDLTDASFSAETTTLLLDDATTLKVRDNVLTGALPKRFLRVKVTAAP